MARVSLTRPGRLTVALEGLVVRCCELRVLCGAAEGEAEVGCLVDGEGCGAGGSGDGEEVDAVDVVEVEAGARVGGCGCDLDVAHLEVVDVAEEEALGGGVGTEHRWVGVLLDCLRG